MDYQTFRNAMIPFLVFSIKDIKRQFPDLDYLKLKLGVANAKELKEKLLQRCFKINMEGMAKDVSPFLFNAEDAKRVILFPQLIKHSSL